MPMGPDRCWKAALRDLQIQLDPRVSRSEANFSEASLDGSWFRAELDCSESKKFSVKNMKVSPFSKDFRELRPSDSGEE